MSDLALAIKLTTEGGQIVVKELTQIGQAAGSNNKELVNTGAAGNAAKKGFDEASEGASTLNSYMSTLKTTAGLLIGSFSAMQLIDTADNWGQMASRIRQATESSDEYNYVQERMIASANDTYRSLTETRESFVMMSPILRDMNYNLGQSIDIVDSFSALLVTNAANADRASGAQAALAKSIQAGKIDADAWQTIFGVMPSILDNITRATGKTGAEIRQLGVSGKLSLTDLTNALLLSYDTNRQAVESMPTTVQDAVQSFSNVFSNYIGWQNEAKGITASVASGIEFLADNFETLVSLVGGVAVAAFVNYSAQAGKAAAANYAKYTSNVALTAAEVKLAQAQVAQTKATLAQATANATHSTGTAAVTAATAAHEAAIRKLTQAQAAQISVGRSLLGVMGGPVGIAITAGIAAASFIEFGSSANSAKEEAKRLKDEAKSLVGAIDDLNKVQAAPQLITAEEKLATAAAAKALLESEKERLEIAKANQEVWSKNIDSKSEKEQLKYAAAVKLVSEELAINAAALQKSSVEIDKYEQRVAALRAVLDGTAGVEAKPNLPIEENKELEKTLLSVYNAQLLNATAVDAYGASLNGIDLELFKAEFVAATKLPEDATAAIKRFAEEAKTANANLEINTYSTELSKQIALLDIRLAKGEQEYELQKALAQFTGADPARLNALQAELAIMQKKQELVADRTTLASLTKENDLLMVRLAHGEKEYEVQKALAALKGKDPAVLAAIEAELRLRQELNEKITISEEIASTAFSSALDDMTSLSRAGEQFGDALTQAFGRVAQQIDGMTSSQVSYNRQLDELAKKRSEVEKLEANSPKRKAALLEIQRTEARLGREHFQAQIGQYAALTGAAAQMFGEQSKEREKLHKLEQAFSVIEMALAMERAAANALAAIANQGTGDPYTAFARIAAMAALMAGLGLFSGSASGNANMSADRQASQGTGTVLGDSDAKSASISNALDRIAELSLDQYDELRAINSSIKALSNGIANLAVSLVSNFGKFNEQSYTGQLGTNKQFQLNDSLASIVALGPLGGAVDQLLGGFVGNIFNSVLGGLSKTTKNLVDSGIAFDKQKLGDIIATGLVEASYYNVVETTKRKLWGLSKKTSTNTEYTALDKELEAEFGRIFGFLGSSITAAVDMLGLDVTSSLDNFLINLPNISFKDLSGEEIASELEAVFSQQADLMTKYLLPSIAEYQQMGEGLYDTLIRVAQEQAIFNAQLDALGLSLTDVSAALRVDIAQGIIELIGGIEQFRDLTAQYFSSFYTESEQFNYLSKTVAQAFESMGLAVPGARDEFRSLVDSLDLTTTAGQELFAQLMQLVPGLDEYFKAMDKQADAAEKAAEAERKLAEQRAAFAAGFERELARLDMSALERTLDDLRTWYAEQIAIAEELGAETEFLERLYARKRADAIAAELDKINTTTANELQRLTSEHERAVSALTTQYQQLVGSITNVSNGIGSAILDIRRQMSGWDETGYQNSIVDSLRGQLGVGDIASQVRTIEQLQQAISARYNAEFAAVNALAQQQQNIISELKSSYDQLLSSVQSATAGINSAMLDIQRQMSGWNEIAYQTAQIAELRSQLGAGTAAEQIALITQLQQAISARYSAEYTAITNLASQQQAVINELKNSYSQLFSSIQSASSAIGSSIQSIQRQMLGFDDVAFQSSLVAQLRGQLGAGTAAEQVALITQLQQAISGRYNAELNANRQLQDAANRRYNDELAAVRAMQNAVAQLRQAADAMLLSGASPELLGVQLATAQTQFNELLAAANGGDADAARQLQQVGSSYLDIARNYYAQGSDEYAAIFDAIQQAYRGVNAPAEPTVPAEVLDYQRNDLALQQSAISELQSLQQLLDGLAAQAASEQAAQISAAEVQLAIYQNQSLALQQNAIGELQSLQQLLDGLAAQAASEQAAQISAAEAQLAIYHNQSFALQQNAIAELSELQLLLAALEQQATLDLEQQTEALLAEFNAQTEALLKSQAEQIAAVHHAADTIVAAIKQLPAPVVEVVVPPPPPVVNVPQVTVDLANPVFTPNDRVEVGPRNDELIAQLRDQHNNTTQQNERLVNEIVRMRTELRRTQDLTLAAQRIA